MKAMRQRCSKPALGHRVYLCLLRGWPHPPPISLR
jgi:hypothetical protein